MMKLWSSMLVLVVVGLVAVGSLSAQEGKKKDRKKGERPTAEQIFKKLDKDGNGKITVDELKANPRMKDKAEEILKRMDTDKSGDVCVKEFGEAMKKRHEAHKRGEHKKGGKKKAEK